MLSRYVWTEVQGLGLDFTFDAFSVHCFGLTGGLACVWYCTSAPWERQQIRRRWNVCASGSLHLFWKTNPTYVLPLLSLENATKLIYLSKTDLFLHWLQIWLMSTRPKSFQYEGDAQSQIPKRKVHQQIQLTKQLRSFLPFKQTSRFAFIPHHQGWRICYRFNLSGKNSQASCYFSRNSDLWAWVSQSSGKFCWK